MSAMKKPDEYSDEEAERRFHALVRRAMRTPPKQLNMLLALHRAPKCWRDGGALKLL